MAIRVASGGTVGSTILGSAAAGQSRERRRQALVAAQALQQRNEAERNRQFTAARDQTRFAQTLQRDQAQNQFRSDFQQQAFDNTLQRDELLSNSRSDLSEQNFLQNSQLSEQGFNQNVQLTELRSQRNRDEFSFELSERQRQEFNQLADVYERAVESGDYTEGELQDLRRQIDARQAGIRPQPRAQRRSPFQPGQGLGDVWQSPDGQYLLTRDQNGNVKKVADTDKPSFRDQLDARKQAYDIAVQSIGESGGDINAEAEKIFNRLMGQPSRSDQLLSTAGMLEQSRAVPRGTQSSLRYAYREVEKLQREGQTEEAARLKRRIDAFTGNLQRQANNMRGQ